MKSAFAVTALLVGLTAVPGLAQTAPVGTWDIVLESPQGAQELTLTVTVNGDKAEGTLTSIMGTMPISGSAKADSVEMSGNLEAQGMTLPITITARSVADTVDGAMKVGDFGEFPLHGKRAAAKATPSASAAPAAPAAPLTGVAGKWNVVLTLTGMGEFPLTATFTQSGDEVTGTISSMAGDVAVKGTFKDAALNLEFTAETPQGPLKVTMVGELKEQNLTGKATLAGVGEADWKAVRSQ